MNKSEAINKIEKYSKDEIIAAIKKVPFCWEQILSKLEQDKERAIFEQADKARQKEIKCLRNLSNWKSKMIKKYGDGNAAKLVDLPPEEIERGAALERALRESTEARQKAERKEDALFCMDLREEALRQ